MFPFVVERLLWVTMLVGSSPKLIIRDSKNLKPRQYGLIHRREVNSLHGYRIERLSVRTTVQVELDFDPLWFLFLLPPNLESCEDNPRAYDFVPVAENL